VNQLAPSTSEAATRLGIRPSDGMDRRYNTHSRRKYLDRIRARHEGSRFFDLTDSIVLIDTISSPAL
jgi:hypothetical protein